MHSNILHVCDHLLDHMGRKKIAQKIDELSTRTFSSVLYIEFETS